MNERGATMRLRAEGWRFAPGGRESAERCDPRGAARPPQERALPRLDGTGRRLTVCLALTASLVGGCTTAQVREDRKASTGIVPGEAIAILTSTGSPLEGEAVGCITEAVRTAIPKVRIVLPDEFRRTVFAAQPPDDEAERAKYLTSLATDPAIRDRMTALGIRYLIAIGGSTRQGGDLKVGAVGGPGGGFFIVFWEGPRHSRLVASILDLTQARQVGELHAEASGHPWFVLVGILPLGRPAFTEGQVCKDIGEAVVNYLTGRNAPEPSPMCEVGNW